MRSPLAWPRRLTVHSFPFSFWTWLTGGPKGKTTTSTFSMFPPLAATVYILVKMNLAPAPDPDPFPGHQQPDRPLTNSSPGASTTTHHRCILGGQFSKLSLRSIASWGPSTTSLTCTPAAWIQVFKQRLYPVVSATTSAVSTPVLRAGSFHVLAHGAQCIAEVCLRDQPFTVDSRPLSCWVLSVVLLCAFCQLAAVRLR